MFTTASGKVQHHKNIVRDMLDPVQLAAGVSSIDGSLLKKGVLSRCIGRTKGGLNSKLHVVCNDAGKPLVMMLPKVR
ncbi:MAG: hypothetical protein ACR65X_06345 [Methylocystis sp.]